MFLLTDTCFWSHAYELFECKIFDINPIISSFRLAFTEAVKEEIIDYCKISRKTVDNFNCEHNGKTNKKSCQK